MRGLIRLALVLSFSPAFSWAGNEVLLDTTKLSAVLVQQADYQLLDARGEEARRVEPIAFSTVYRINTSINKNVVLVIAEDDATAVAIAQSITPASNRLVHAVQGGSATWRRVIANVPATPSVSGSFVIPKNTCEQGKPIQELKRDKPLLQFKNH